jgi:chromosomal replication initiation ATPase DnaA
MIRIGQLVLDLPHRPALGRDDFLVAANNEDAVGWIDRWPDWPARALIVHGAAGCGKTHLAEVWRTRSGAVLVAGAALAVDEVPAMAQSGAVALDDAERAPERALLHLYNLLGERGGSLLLTAAAPPIMWEMRLADLRSRLLALPSVAVGPPDEALIGALLLKLFADRQLAVTEDVVLFLVPRIERSFAAARRVVDALDRAALGQRRRITVRLAREVLQQEPDPPPP